MTSRAEFGPRKTNVRERGIGSFVQNHFEGISRLVEQSQLQLAVRELQRVSNVLRLFFYELLEHG